MHAFSGHGSFNIIKLHYIHVGGFHKHLIPLKMRHKKCKNCKNSIFMVIIYNQNFLTGFNVCCFGCHMGDLKKNASKS